MGLRRPVRRDGRPPLSALRHVRTCEKAASAIPEGGLPGPRPRRHRPRAVRTLSPRAPQPVAPCGGRAETGSVQQTSCARPWPPSPPLLLSVPGHSSGRRLRVAVETGRGEPSLPRRRVPRTRAEQEQRVRADSPLPARVRVLDVVRGSSSLPEGRGELREAERRAAAPRCALPCAPETASERQLRPCRDARDRLHRQFREHGAAPGRPRPAAPRPSAGEAAVTHVFLSEVTRSSSEHFEDVTGKDKCTLVTRPSPRGRSGAVCWGGVRSGL